MLAFEGVEVRYGQQRVLSGVTARFEPGKIHALVGENGAGKTSLLKTAAGLVANSRGKITIGERTRERWTAEQSLDAGLRMVFQHTALVGSLSILENVQLACKGWGTIDFGAARERLLSRSKELQLHVPLDLPVAQLSVPEQQRAELLRAMYDSCCVLVLDEPTAVLPPGEIAALYGLLRRIADTGVSVVVVTHKLSEVATYADTATALRRGAIAGRRALVPNDTMDDVVAWVMGEAAPASNAASQVASRGSVVVRLRDVVAGALRGLSVELRSGEVLGLAGVDGNGQDELSAVIEGALVPARGRLEQAQVEAVVIFEDRQRDGLVLDGSVSDNALLGMHTRFSHWGMRSRAGLRRDAAHVLGELSESLVPHRDDGGRERLDVFAMPARALSGGNQQKIVVARAVERVKEAHRAGRQCVLFAHFPTRGVDIGSALHIHAQLRALAREFGACVVLRSADLDELRTNCDRMVVLCAGMNAGEFGPEVSDEALGQAMLGMPDPAKVALSC